MVVQPALPSEIKETIHAASCAMWSKYFENIHEPGVMEDLNEVYIDWYGEDKRSYIGQRDVDEWGETVANAFWALDLDAILNPLEWRIRIEPTPGGRTEFCESHKMSIPLGNGKHRVVGKAFLWHG